MSRQKLKLTSWLWILYPILVVVFIAVSSNILLNNQDRFMKMMERKDSIEEQEVKVAELQRKIAVLDKADLVKEGENLKDMVKTVPASKLVWALVTELKLAASESGVFLESYKGSVGDVKEASAEAEATLNDTIMELDVIYVIPDFESLRRLLTSLEHRKPLVRVNKMKYQAGRLEIWVEGAWKAWEKVAGTDAPMPEYQSVLTEVKEKVDSYQSFEDIDLSGLGEDTGTTNPF